ncbi:MAG: TSUP family transporter, partial [Dehalococcoidia bacterium]|nr:TSUP family transporter [Dehalococcoidia bacterium]
GTSVAAIILTSIGGIVGYIVNGLGVSDLLPYSLGYINLPIWLCLAATSIPMAQLGARAAHALPAKPLRYILIAFMVYAGLDMIGVFH